MMQGERGGGFCTGIRPDGDERYGAWEQAVEEDLLHKGAAIFSGGKGG